MKEKVSKIRNGRGKRRGNASGEESDHPTLSSQSGPGILVEGESGGDIEVGGGKDDPRPGDSKSVLRSAVEIRHGQGGSDDKAGEGEISQKHLHPHPHVQTEGESSQGGRDVDGKRTDQVDPPPLSDTGIKSPISSTSRVGESEST